GVELCRRIRTLPADHHVYAILLTSRNQREDLLAGLEAGADDYITKPFDHQELRARINPGLRVLSLQQALAHRVRDLEHALARVNQLQGLLPICSYCKSVRHDQGYWEQVDHYLAAHTDVQVSHGICPACYKDVIEPQLNLVRPSSH